MYERAQTATLQRRIEEPRRFIQVLIGPRQVGKTTSLRQALAATALPSIYATADTATLESAEWLAAQWSAARATTLTASSPVVLAIDEIQKVGNWSSWVKRFWDEDTAEGRDIRVVLSGSSPLLMQQGLSESLAGRHEIIRYTHWLWPECRDAFGWDLDTFIFYGGYPGAAQLLPDHERWRAYVLDSIVETTVSRDILLMTRVDKPALLRRLFSLACEYSSRELTYAKMVGALTDAGNTTTLAHYLDLLDASGLVAGLQKYSGDAARRRRSTPKLAVYNTALSTAMSGLTFEAARSDPATWGRMTESAVGAHLLALAHVGQGSLYYWRNRIGSTDVEVDFVFADHEVTALEVKSASGGTDHAGLLAFERAFGPHVHTILIGPGGISLDTFLSQEAIRS